MAIRYNYVDAMLTDDGDISISDGDFSLCSNSKCFAQHVKMRCLTNKDELPMHPNIGTDLDELEGMPNIRSTGDYGVDKIRTSLGTESPLPMNSITVKGVPVAHNNITFFIYADVESSGDITRTFVDIPVFLDGGFQR
jgi:hypothetical protein